MHVDPYENEQTHYYIYSMTFVIEFSVNLILNFTSKLISACLKLLDLIWDETSSVFGSFLIELEGKNKWLLRKFKVKQTLCYVHQ